MVCPQKGDKGDPGKDGLPGAGGTYVPVPGPPGPPVSVSIILYPGAFMSVFVSSLTYIYSKILYFPG